MVSKTYCPLLWHHLCVHTTGNLRPCCVSSELPEQVTEKSSVEKIINNPTHIKMRQQVINNLEPSECKSACFDRERKGLKSKRLIEIDKHKRKYGETLYPQAEALYITPSQILSVDFKPSNYCNLACVMCGPRSSSRWGVELQKVKNVKSQHFFGGWYNEVRSFLPETFTSVLALKINGGETSILPELDSIFTDFFSYNKTKNPTATFTINNTHDFVGKYHKFLQQFEHVTIVSSIDGWKTHNDYIRFPSKWNTVKTNIDKLNEYSLSQFNTFVQFDTVISALNYYHYPDFLINLFNNYKCVAQRHQIITLTNPPDYQVKALPNWMLTEGYEKLKTTVAYIKNNFALSDYTAETLQNAIRYYELSALEGCDEATHNQFITKIRKLDERRQINISRFIPELSWVYQTG
jgi:hypothetical protein